ncbi:MAG: arylsulfatase B [Polaribacter sp.]|jgi:arylsulfatase B
MPKPLQDCRTLTFILFSLLFSTINLSAQNRPNILVIIADDVGIDAISAYGLGMNLPSTPNIDALISEGILFTNAWSYPTCAPSRASMLTGRFGNKNGVMQSGPNLANNQNTIFEQIETITNGAYADAVIGKWHLGNDNSPNTQGVDHYIGSIPCCVPDYNDWERTENGVTNPSTEYVTTHYTDEAIDWLDNQTAPWLLWVAHNAPHSPFHIPPDSLYTWPQTNGNQNQFMCMIESVDHEVGRLYNSLTQEQKDSTLIIFVGDNGTPNNVLQEYPNMHGKGTLYEGGIRVPMFVTGYGVTRMNEQEDALVSFSDIFATVTELLGTDLQGGIDNSFSFYPLLSDQNAAQKRYNYSELGTNNTARAIRNNQYKLIQQSDGSQEFFDLQNDPLETTDLLINGLSADQQIVIEELENEADSIFYSWSCNDGIKNGDEAAIDCGGSSCFPCLLDAVEETTAENETLIFPNPAANYIHVQSKKKLIQEIKIYDALGQLVFFKNNINAFAEKVNLEGLNPQVYIMHLSFGDRLEVHRFVRD